MDTYLILPLLSLLLNLGLSVLMWVRRPGEEAGRALDAFKDQVAQQVRDHKAAADQAHQLLSGRLTELETHMEHMPTTDELRKLEVAVMQIAERTSGLSEGMAGMRASLSRIETWLLNQSSPKP